jgi:hypothetical protein
MVFLLSFVAIRAASFHHVDILLSAHLAGLKLNWILELGGIAFVAFGAYRSGAAPATPALSPPSPARASRRHR